MSNLHQTYLNEIANKTANEVHFMGFAYLHYGLIPRMLEAGKLDGFDKIILSKCWSIVAAVYKINGAPKRAIECIKKAIALNSSNVELHMELMNLQIFVGAFHDAFGAVDKAMNLEPDNMKLHTIRQQIQDDINYESEPLFAANDPIWKLNELLADEKFENVINTVLDHEMDNVAELQCLARAFGAVAHHANYLNVWQSIVKLHPSIVPDFIDWFYLPVELRENKLMKSVFSPVNQLK